MDRLKVVKFDDSKAAYNLIAVINLRRKRRVKQVTEEIELLMAPFIPGVQ